MADHLFVSSAFQKQLDGVELVPPDTPASPSLPEGVDYSISKWAADNRDNLVSISASPHPAQQDPEYNWRYMLTIVLPLSINEQVSKPKRLDKVYLDIDGLNVVGEITGGAFWEHDGVAEYSLVITPSVRPDPVVQEYKIFAFTNDITSGYMNLYTNKGYGDDPETIVRLGSNTVWYNAGGSSQPKKTARLFIDDVEAKILTPWPDESVNISYPDFKRINLSCEYKGNNIAVEIMTNEQIESTGQFCAGMKIVG